MLESEKLSVGIVDTIVGIRAKNVITQAGPITAERPHAPRLDCCCGGYEDRASRG